MRKLLQRCFGIALVALLTGCTETSPRAAAFDGGNPREPFDVVVYETTPAGVMAAVAAARRGMRVALLGSSSHIGGMVSSGLGNSDIGDPATIGGLSREFFLQVGKEYGTERPVYKFEPHVARRVFEEMLRENRVSVFLNHPIQEVTKSGSRIQSMRSSRGQQFPGKVFVDASYEGDLMHVAGVSYAVGREGSDEFGEKFAGFQRENSRHSFDISVPARDSSGRLLRGVSAETPVAVGTGDSKVPAYNFRLCLTKDPGNMVPISAPEDYDPQNYELLALYLAMKPGIKLGSLMYFFKLPNDKVDINNRGPISTNLIGGSWGYPEADSVARRKIWQAHRNYQQGLLYFLGHDRRVSARLREHMLAWGFCKDEFVDSGHWPPQLYVREARRMRGEYVLREADLTGPRAQPDSIGKGSMPIESHHVQRIADVDGSVLNEGSVVVRVRPYSIPYRSMLPKRNEAQNLLNPVTLSASHVAFSSVRMEPVYMILGHSAGTAAALAVSQGASPHDLQVSTMQKALREEGQVL
ncbi:MAG: FAD-dependent oxidoreductase [Bdellovibrionales bacterium]|nr:FAD-dependent oxidoreductase [Bdellovibrionales bacterium]